MEDELEEKREKERLLVMFRIRTLVQGNFI